MRRYARTLVVIGVLVALASLALGFQTIKIGGFERGGDTLLGLNLGLDLQGGIDLRYQALDPVTGEHDKNPDEEDMRELIRSIERRVNASGLGKPNIQILGGDRLLVQLPGVRDTARAKSLIGETAQLVYKRRELNVVRDNIAGVSAEDILNVSLVIGEEELAALTATSPSALATTTDEGTSRAVATTTEEGALAPAATTTAATLGDETQDELGPPILVIEFAEPAAEAFGKVVDQLRESLDPVPGTEGSDPNTGELGSRGVYPNFLTISAEGDVLAPISMPYSPLLTLPTGQSFPLGGEPYIQRIEDGNRFTINLVGAVEDVAEAKARFGGEPELRLGEILGRVDEDIPGGLTGDDMARAYPGQHQVTGLPIVNIVFNGEGARKFAEVTTEMAGTSDLLAIFLDDRELIASSVRAPITGGAGYIEGPDFTFARVSDISLLLESGRLPISIELIKERDVDAILGADSLAKSVVAGLIGLSLVLLFMALYYRAPGVVAAIALMIYAALALTIFKILPVTLELSGVAAAILSIGMAVDANILIFERMKEELRAGRTLLSAINIGFNRAWPAIRDSNVSTLITCAILFWFADTLGAPIVQSFAATLAIGVGISMFSAITVSRTFLRLLAATPLAKRLGLFVPSGGADLPQQQPRPEAV